VLEMMPLTGLILLAILHWPQAEALFGLGPAEADFSIALKAPPTWSALTLPMLGLLVLVMTPYAEELIRGSRAQSGCRSERSLAGFVSAETIVFVTGSMEPERLLDRRVLVILLDEGRLNMTQDDGCATKRRRQCVWPAT
jgi:hypothetical protein